MLTPANPEQDFCMIRADSDRPVTFCSYLAARDVSAAQAWARHSAADTSLLHDIMRIDAILALEVGFEIVVYTRIQGIETRQSDPS